MEFNPQVNNFGTGGRLGISLPVNHVDSRPENGDRTEAKTSKPEGLTYRADQWALHSPSRRTHRLPQFAQFLNRFLPIKSARVTNMLDGCLRQKATVLLTGGQIGRQSVEGRTAIFWTLRLSDPLPTIPRNQELII